jgi:hypothetical protein
MVTKFIIKLEVIDKRSVILELQSQEVSQTWSYSHFTSNRNFRSRLWSIDREEIQTRRVALNLCIRIQELV